MLAKARENLALATDHNRSNVQRLADAAESEQVRLQESGTLMDRAGLTAKTSVEIDVGLKPYEEVLAGVAKITRAQHDALMAGLPAAAELAQRQPDPYYDTEPAAPKPGPRTTSDDGNVIDAEVVPLETMEAAMAATAQANRAAGLWATKPRPRRSRGHR